MSLRAILEVIVHASTFKNIDLAHQGLYQLRISIFNENEIAKFKAQPYRIVESLKNEKKGEKIKKNNLHFLIPSHIFDEEYMFCSQSFLIRYCDEEVQINELCKFRTEIDVVDGYIDQHYYLEVQLMFSDLLNIGGPDKVASFGESLGEFAEMRVMAEKRYRIVEMAQGIYQYVPVIFDEEQFSILNLTLHSSLIEFRYRNTTLLESGGEEAVKIIPLNKKRELKKRKIDEPRTNITEFLFGVQGNNGLDYKGDLNEADEIYNNFARVLIGMHQRLHTTFSILHEQCLSKNNKTLHKEELQAFALILPGMEAPKEKPVEKEKHTHHHHHKHRKSPRPGQKGTVTVTKTVNFPEDPVTAQIENLGENENEESKEMLIPPDSTPYRVRTESKGSEKCMLQGKDIELDIEDEGIVMGGKKIPSAHINPSYNGGKGVGRPRTQEENKYIYSNTNITNITPPIVSITAPLKRNIEERKTGDKKRKKPRKKMLVGALPLIGSPARPMGSIGILPKAPNYLNFTDRCTSREPSDLASQFLTEINSMAAQIFELWYKYELLLRISPRNVCDHLQEEYKHTFTDKIGESVIKEPLLTPTFELPSERDIGEMHKQSASQRRKNPKWNTISPLKIVEDEYFKNVKKTPLLFEEVVIRPIPGEESLNVEDHLNKTPLRMGVKELEIHIKRYKGIHLFVLMHGFQGNSYDMRIIRNNIAYVYPDAQFLCSVENENHTEGDIAEMAIKLANEVITYVKDWCPHCSLGRLSFIGHSLGGVVIRAALPYLRQFKDRMYTYITLSSPHLGYMYNSSKLVDAGIWIMKKWRKSKCLQQLSMTDSKNPTDCYLYKLSEIEGLGWFQNMALVSSYQDTYAPFESARIEISEKAGLDKKGAMYKGMVENLLGRLNCQYIMRLDVNFKISSKNLDTFIGRAAHILFLDNSHLMKMLLYRYPSFFA